MTFDILGTLKADVYWNFNKIIIKTTQISSLQTECRGVYHSSEKVYEIFQNNGIFRDFLQIFLENKRIFDKGVRDFGE